MKNEVSVILPCYNAAQFLKGLVLSLLNQEISPVEIIVVDSQSTDNTEKIARELGCKVFSISQTNFNHGGTRNFASLQAKGDLLVFMTQDALPADPFFLQHLLDPIISGKTVASFARQIPYPNASAVEKFARVFNYPPDSQIRTAASIKSMGIGAYFFSNVSSAIRKDVFLDVGMFADNVIMNEDMLLCANLLNNGHNVAYAAKAQVYHSHDYSLKQTFRRYFDIGVFFSRNLHILNVSAGLRGANYSRSLILEMTRQSDWIALFNAFFEIGAKLAGYRLGKLEKFIPVVIKKRLSMHTGYWNPKTPNKAVF
jgi:rhamnosyltransferase